MEERGMGGRGRDIRDAHMSQPFEFILALQTDQAGFSCFYCALSCRPAGPCLPRSPVSASHLTELQLGSTIDWIKYRIIDTQSRHLTFYMSSRDRTQVFIHAQQENFTH